MGGRNKALAIFPKEEAVGSPAKAPDATAILAALTDAVTTLQKAPLALGRAEIFVQLPKIEDTKAFANLHNVSPMSELTKGEATEIEEAINFKRPSPPPSSQRALLVVAMPVVAIPMEAGAGRFDQAHKTLLTLAPDVTIV
jgi:hypothetical protein